MKAISILKSNINGNLFISTRQLQNILIVSVAVLTTLLAPWIIAPAQAAVKWHPGHYMVLVGANGKYNPSYREDVYRDLKETPTLRGVVVRYSWGELEKSKGDYDFSNIQQILDDVSDQGKRLIILLELKAATAKSLDKVVPDYMKTPAYDGGFYNYSNRHVKGRRGIKLWNPQVEERFRALVRALGDRFDNNPHFEGVGFTETAMGNPKRPLSGSTVDAYYNNLLELNKFASANFPNTMTFQYMNYPRDTLGSYINTFKNTGGAVGCPDVFLQDPGLLCQGTDDNKPCLYTYYPKLSGELPLVVQIEHANYLNTRYDKKGHKPNVSELLNFARDKLDVNYVFWVRIPGYFPKVKELLNFQTQRGTPAGGLKSACPSAYPGCKS